MAKLNKPCPVNAADVEFLVGKDYNNNVVDVPISSLPDFPEVDVECALQDSPTIRDLKAEDAKLLQLYLALKSRLDDFRILPIHLKNSIEALEELNLCNVRITLCDVEWDTVFHGKVTTEDVLTSPEIVTDNLTVNDTAMINDEEVANSHITTLASDDATIERLTVNESIDDKGTLNVEWQTTTKGIINDGNISSTWDFTNDWNITNGGNITNAGNIVNEWDIDNTGNINTDTMVANGITSKDIQTETLWVSEKAIINEAEIDTETVTNSTITVAKITDETVTNSSIENAEIYYAKITEEEVDTAVITYEEVTQSVIEDATITKATISEEEVDKSTIQDATIVKEKVTDSEIENATITNETVTNSTIDKATINEATITTETVTDSTIENATITTEKVDSSEIRTLDVTENIHDRGTMTIDGHTDLNSLEVNGEANFREPVNVYDDFYVSGDYTLNGEGKFNGPEVHNGEITYNGDVVFNGKLTADDIDIDVNLEDYQKKDEKGRTNGYASLDSTGKVPMSQLPNIAWGISYKGEWNAGTWSYPSNASNGDMYYCSNGWTVAGIVYNKWDRIIYDSNASSWFSLPDNYGVQSVNGRIGVVVDVQDTTDRKDVIDLVNPATDKYLSEKAVADLVNPLIERIEELELSSGKMDISVLNQDSWLPASMTEDIEYTVPILWMSSNMHPIILDTVTNGNIVIETFDWYIKIRSSANETNPVVNVLFVKSA